jgi:virginiamycin B lyase
VNRPGWRSHLTALLTALIACVSLLSLSCAPAWATAGTIKEFPTPTKSAPIAITAGPDRALWFTEFTNGAGAIGRITPSGRFTVFPFPTANSGPSAITAGPDGNLWFTEFDGNAIDRITPSSSLTGIFGIPTALSRPEGITAGPAHTSDVWFTEENASKIGRITTQ